VIGLANAGDTQVAALVTDYVAVQPTTEYLLPHRRGCAPAKLFAYFMALEHGVDVDRPRNSRRRS